jgi:DNA (cytosine-5)-methyltransferase 1
VSAYYNEFDPKAAAWLRELIKRGLIADGVVDERSILDVSADDLVGFTQCHFFAGIGGWSYALRLAGWSDDQPVWTGSPPCQPFSAAGQQKGKDDDRHLAPHFAALIVAGRPPILFGEQVASAAVFGKAAKRTRSAASGAPEWTWIDDLQDRLEAAHYAVGASDIPAAGVGAPHIRQRTFFGAVRLGDPSRPAGKRDAGSVSGTEAQEHGARVAVDGPLPVGPKYASPSVGGLADAGCPRGVWGQDASRSDKVDAGQWHEGAGNDQSRSSNDRLADAAGGGRHAGFGHIGEARVKLHDEGGSEAGGLADANGGNTSAEREQRGGQQRQQQEDSGAGCMADADAASEGMVRNSPSEMEQRAAWHARAGHWSGSGDGGLPDAESIGRVKRRADAVWMRSRDGAERSSGRSAINGGMGRVERPSPTNGHWRDADWLFCRDGKWRPVEPGTFPLAHGVPARVGRLRGYGNAIVPQAAALFVTSFLEAIQ